MTALRAFLQFILLAAAATAAPQDTSRITFTINDQWRYAAGPLADVERLDFDDSRWSRVTLPHTWNAADAFDKEAAYRRGDGWYRRRLKLDSGLRGKRLFLHFEGANQVADVWVNGRHAGRHIGGYTAFTFDVTSLVSFEGENVLAVRVDNSHDPDIPPLNGDFTFHGGIYRDVWLLATSPVHFTATDHGSPGVFVSTPEISAARAVPRVRGTVVNESGRTRRLRVVTKVLDAARRTVSESTWSLTVPAGAAHPFDRTMPAVAQPRLWSPDDPYVHRVRFEIHDGDLLADAVEVPLGFRWFGIDATKGFSLNGMPLKLVGTNRHQDLAGHGNALSDDLHRRDVRLIKENGFNFLRLAHYPQDPAVLDEADRLGLIVWEEIPIVNLIGTSAAFAETSERMLVEMIRQHHNHPSVLFWGYMNEVLLTKPNPVPDRYYEIVPELARRLEARARAEDRTRATVMALSRDELADDRGLGAIPDVLGLNLYFGWYYEKLETLGTFLDELHRDRPATPLIVSEYGAGSDERVHAFEPRPFDFSSEYAQLFHVASLPQIETRPFVLGSAVWNQFDFGSAGRQDTKFALNQKGLYFHDRTPKDTMDYYRAALRDEPVLHIAGEWAQRAGSRIEDRMQPLWVYTNLEEVELFVNGRSAGVRKVENRTARWTAELGDGANVIRAVGRRSDRTLASTAVVTYSDRSRQFMDDGVPGLVVAVNAGGDYAYRDEAGVYWEADRPYQSGSWGYVDGSGTRTHHRIFGTADDPLFQASREALTRYRFDVPDGSYELTLGFAEGRRDAPPGRHVFDVSANDRTLIAGLDLAASPGPNTALTRTFLIEVAGGRGIDIAFDRGEGSPAVAAIKMVRR